MVWEKGRQLKSFGSNVYTYNAAGIRTSKTVGGIKHTYTLDGAKILREQWVEGEDIKREITPLYDNEDNVCGILYCDIPYYFLKNLQGDVIAITNQRGETVARYTYDAWGACTISYDTTATPAVEGGEPINIATVNPFRYRSYYFDTETGLYYLQSRYYDPVLGRFVNIDSVVGANGDFSTYSLYTYCGNEPICRSDCSGAFWKNVWSGLKNAASGILHSTNNALIKLGLNTAAIGARFLDMYKDAHGVYHARFNCWQQYFGYNDLYDIVFDLCTSMKNAKFPFKASGKWYILWAWKGNYINLGAGAELGIYYGGEPHWLVDKSLAMEMSMSVKYRGKEIINFSSNTWWLTGFNPNYLDVKATDLKVAYTVKFNKRALYNAFRRDYKKSWSFNDCKRTAKYTL